MVNIETFHHKKRVAAETVGFRFEADLFKWVPMILGFGCHRQHRDVSPQENDRCRNGWFQIRSPPQISTDYYRCCRRGDNIEMFHHQKMVDAESVDFRFEADTSSNLYRCSWALAVMYNTETFRNEKMVLAETVGFRFDADLFKSVQIIQGFGGHGQHWDLSP